jgi:hypothetical protein
MAAVALVAVAAALAGAWVRATYGARTSADEPHYLLTAISLAEDGDLDVSDEHAAERWRPFHEVTLPPQAAARPDGTMVVPHDPLLPALLAGPVALAGPLGAPEWLAAKAALAVLAGVTAVLTLWLAVRRFELRVTPAATIVGLFAASAPLAAYGSQVYPELPAALALLVLVSAGTGPARARNVAAVVVAVVALPWLAVKYVPVAAAATLVVGWRWWREGARREVAVAAGVLAVAGALYVAGHVAWYGGLTVYAAGEFFQQQGGQLSVVGTQPNYLARTQRLLGLVVDRGFGLAAWQPAWLALVPAVVVLVRRRPPAWTALVVPLAAGWLTATFVAVTMHGWWFPGRQLVVVLPLAVVAIAWWVDRSRAAWVVTVVAGVVGVWSYVWLVVAGVRGDIAWIVDLTASPDPWYRLWRLALPDYLQPTATTWVLHGLWLAAAAVAAAAAWRRASQPSYEPTSSAVMPRSS